MDKRRLSKMGAIGAAVVAIAVSGAAQEGPQVVIHFADSSAQVENGAGSGVVVRQDKAHLKIMSTDENVNYVLSGHCVDGSLELESARPFSITLDGVELANETGPVIEMVLAQPAQIHLAEKSKNILTDGAEYENKAKGVVCSDGDITFTGSGALQINGVGENQHAIFSKMSIIQNSGDIKINSAAKDGLHAGKSIQISGGSLNVTASSDALDAKENVEVSGGKIELSCSAEDVCAINCGADYIMKDGTVVIAVSGDRSSAVKTDGNVDLQGGSLQITHSGDVVLEQVTDVSPAYTDPKYSKAINCGKNLMLSGGALTINHNGLAGRCIDVDGDARISGGKSLLKTTGECTEDFTDEQGGADVAAADGLKVKGNLDLLDGELTIISTGTAGAGISVKGTLTFGAENSKKAPIVTVTTEGDKVALRGQGWNSGAENPKAIKADGDVIIHDGKIKVTALKDGGEGIESKSEMIINGGTIEIEAFDDCLNAVTKITVNDGMIYCFSTGNDGMDCNGPLEFNGGIVISSGIGMPEEGFDCDNNPFIINGGILLGSGGATSTPSNGKQAAVILSGEGTEDTILQITSDSGEVLTYRVPRTYGGGMGGGMGFGGMGGPGGFGGGFGGMPPEMGDMGGMPPEMFAGMMPPTDMAGGMPPADAAAQPDRGRRPRGNRGERPAGGMGRGEMGRSEMGPGGFGGGMGGFGGGMGGMFGGGNGPMNLLVSAPTLVVGNTYTLIEGADVSGGTEFHGLITGATVSGGTKKQTFVVDASSTAVIEMDAQSE
ncbi:MAG: carbohydrate-binding domain-containing protein [Pontiellaceae bacterium]|nr:carbohydrate-binding domain-containing protein [Pontiellaceae bacterium]